uniref:Uncharacterized protein n=1 Tax=Triticum urartu TaxID=4572 RepID=A0A8R7VFE4_TRIUA
IQKRLILQAYLRKLHTELKIHLYRSKKRIQKSLILQACLREHYATLQPAPNPSRDAQRSSDVNQGSSRIPGHRSARPHQRHANTCLVVKNATINHYHARREGGHSHQ